jgi:hypothetical protein
MTIDGRRNIYQLTNGVCVSYMVYKISFAKVSSNLQEKEQRKIISNHFLEKTWNMATLTQAQLTGTTGTPFVHHWNTTGYNWNTTGVSSPPLVTTWEHSC